jgi:hypothetical protein
MRFKIKISETTKHTEICTAVRWTVNNEAYSLSDDNTILKWDPNSLEVPYLSLPIEFETVRLGVVRYGHGFPSWHAWHQRLAGHRVR